MAAALVLAACTGPATGPAGSSGGTAASSSAAPPTGAPALQVEVVLDGLDHPWDVAQAPDDTLLVDQRGGGFTAVLPDGSAREIRADFGDLFAQGETGLMGLTLDLPGHAQRLDRRRRLDGRRGLERGHPRRRPAHR
jgi:glucose/arabinose dehydrogenase